MRCSLVSLLDAVRCFCTCVGVCKWVFFLSFFLLPFSSIYFIFFFAVARQGSMGQRVVWTTHGPELTCVPINTAVTLLTCSPASSTPTAKHTEIQHWGQKVQEGGSKDNTTGNCIHFPVRKSTPWL